MLKKPAKQPKASHRSTGYGTKISVCLMGYSRCSFGFHIAFSNAALKKNPLKRRDLSLLGPLPPLEAFSSLGAGHLLLRKYGLISKTSC